MRSLLRLLRILLVAARYRLDQLLPRDRLPRPLAFLLWCSPLRLMPAPDMTAGERLRHALQDLGPIFIKFGQALSTRRDLLPEDIADQLAELQDNVPPFPGSRARELIEGALGRPVSDCFSRFSEEPLASASVAQVHGATLPDGRDVVVKVIRPGIRQPILQDIALLLTLARLAERYLPDGRRLRPVEVVTDYRDTVLDELDLQREAANTSQLRRNFLGSELLYVPEVHFDYCRPNLLVMERIHGIPVSDIRALHAQGTDLKKLAERGVEIFFTQVFRDNFFHADMHPGNIFVSREHPENPQYIGIDCAIIGSLSDFDRYYLARNLLAIFERDYHLVARLHVECGWVPPTTRVQEFEAAIRSTCEPVFEKPLAEISFGQLLVYLFRTARRFNMEIQPSLVLLQKTLLNIEGLGRELYPQLDLWQTAKPYLEKWLRERYAPGEMLQQLRRQAPHWLERLPQLPDLVIESLGRTAQAGELISLQQQQVELLQRERQGRRQRRHRLALAGAAVILGLVIARPDLLRLAENLPQASLALFALAAFLLLRR